MKALRARCLLGSCAFHAFLLALLLVGSGFLAPPPAVQEEVIANFVSEDAIVAALSRGGDPQGTAGARPRPEPQPAPAEPQPQPPKVDPVKPEARPPAKPVKAVEKPAPKEPKETKQPAPKPPRTESVAVAETDSKKPAPSKPKIEVSKKLVTRKPGADKTTQRDLQAEAAEAEAAAAAEAVRRAEAYAQVRRGQIGSAVDRLRTGLSTASVTAVPLGPGGGGEVTVGYDHWVVALFERAWRPPAELADEQATTKVQVVIARDGRVISATIVGKSGIASLDHSVQATLQRVTHVGRPFPDEFQEDRRTLMFNFNLKSKRGLG